MNSAFEEICREALKRITPTAEERKKIHGLAEELRQKVTKAGRVVIPKELREELGWVEGTKLKVIIEGKRVILEEVHEH